MVSFYGGKRERDLSMKRRDFIFGVFFLAGFIKPASADIPRLQFIKLQLVGVVPLG